MNTLSSYCNNLINTVLRCSDATKWDAAVSEWRIEDVEEDKTLSESCVCGKEKLKYLFTIRNKFNGQKIYPIGSSCIKKFERSDLNEEVAVKVQLFKLLHAIEYRRYLVLSSKYFSRKLLRYLYDLGGFKPSLYNQFNPYNDYQFMLNMFNKKNRSKRQDNRTTAIILNSIKPFLRDMLSDKIH